MYLEDGEIAQLSLKNGLKLKTIANQEKTPYIQELEMHLEAAMPIFLVYFKFLAILLKPKV